MAPTFEELVQENPGNGKPQRPAVILVFAILTFVWSGPIALLFLLSSVPIDDPMQLPFWVAFPTFLLSAGKIVGASLMITMKKIGFWLYTGSEIFLIVVWIGAVAPLKDIFYYMAETNYNGRGDEYFEMAPYVYVLPWFFVPFSIAWIIVYGSQLKKMR